MISPYKIKYNNISSNELNVLDLIMCVAFDSDNGETSSFINREAVSSETHDGRYRRVAQYKYSESFSPKFTFMKKGFENFSIEEVRQVLKWLTSLDTTSVLDVYYDGTEAVEWSAIGGWTEISTYKLANNRTVGIVATFEAVTPYAMSDLYTVTKTITAANNKITINIDTDDNKPVYPRVTIQANSTNIKFVNTHTDFFSKSTPYESIELTNNAIDEKIVVDGANKLITTTTTNRKFGDDFNWTWLALHDGKNEITVTGNCTVEISYREIRKIGEY
jgi:hypothetical protein